MFSSFITVCAWEEGMSHHQNKENLMTIKIQTSFTQDYQGNYHKSLCLEHYHSTRRTWLVNDVWIVCETWTEPRIKPMKIWFCYSFLAIFTRNST